MKKSYSVLLKLLIGFFVFFFLVFQIYNTFYNPMTTETAVYHSTYDGITLTGYSIRNDLLIESTADGVKSYTAKDGEKVAKDSVIVNLYSDSSAVSDAGRIREIDAQLKSLRELQTFSEGSAADLSIIDTQISQAYNELLSNAHGSKFSNIAQLSNNLLSLMNKKQVTTGQVTDFAAQIAALESEKNSLISGGATPTDSITAPSSGYFVSSCDGYETVLKVDDIDTLNPEKLNNLIPVTGGNYAGKIVTDFSWYIAANISFDDSLRFSEGDSLTLRVNLSDVTDLPVTVYRINKGESDSLVTVIFECKYMNGELASVRSQPVTAILTESKGLRISNKAIRIVDGVKGVYILSGSTAKFKTIEILYSEDDYSICRMDDIVSGSLSLYDEVIVKGKNLYDGKIVG